jgi:hypothetical protein
MNYINTLGSIIQEKRHTAISLYNSVLDDSITDNVGNVSDLTFGVHQSAEIGFNKVCAKMNNKYVPLHNNALSQLCSKLKIPKSYITELGLKSFGGELIAHNLNTLAQNNIERVLIRENRNQIKAVLSENYKRLDSKELLTQFISACKLVGAVPYDAYTLDTKMEFRVLLPKVFKLSDNEFDNTAFGLSFKHSDYGTSALSVQLFKIRLICRNGMTTTTAIREVHLSSSISNNIQFAQDTLDSDSKTASLKLRDSVKNCLSDVNLKTLLMQCSEARKDVVSESKVTKLLLPLEKSHSRDIKTLFYSPDNVNMPSGHTRERLAETVSFFSQKFNYNETALDLENFAGSLMTT